MSHAPPSVADFPDPSEAQSGDFSSTYTARLLGENVQLQEEVRALRTRAVNDRQQARYYKKLHQRAVERLGEKDRQIEAFKAKVCELQHRLFGRKSEQGKVRAIEAELLGPKRGRGQQHGGPGHGRTLRKHLPVVEVEVLPPAGQIFCGRCSKPWVPIGEPEVREQIEWEVRMVRLRTKRPKYRRPDGCTCEDGRPDIVCAPPPPSLIPKGLLGISFIVQALLLKFQHGMPAHRILAMVRNEGMPLSPGTLCGVFQRIAPFLVPLYEAICSCSRQQELALMDETRWEVFIETVGKASHRWWLWIVVTRMTRLYILSPSRSSATPKDYVGHDKETQSVAYHKQVMVDRYPGYAFLKDLLDLAYCWVHVRRDFLEARREGKDLQWADAWVMRIGQLYALNKERLALGCTQNPARELPAPFVELDAERMENPEYRQADLRLREAVEAMAAAREEELDAKDLRLPRRKILQSLQAHWHGLTLFVNHAQIPMDNNGAERVVRPAAVARKNFYGSGAKWSGDLLAMLMTLFQTLLLHKVDPRKYLTAYLQACADNASCPPAIIKPWLPWNFCPPENPSQETGPLQANAPCQGPSP